ncbi:hypothetical protein APY94_04530 [Thermococcus celericrescens]|uniref:Glycosyl transferase family 1 domain-containing protein n=1 Tax=Thermococcus celericrescens TaxID=227598 RepID=A0A117ITU1_9EURY|nr:glycosyltransferase [Thermococcus celericrescens]KUH33793.1 hypothetical protein APY94_04530 [Thermococcus celericrescens]
MVSTPRKHQRKVKICLWGNRGSFYETHIRLLKSCRDYSVVSIGSSDAKGVDIELFESSDGKNILRTFIGLLGRLFRVPFLFSKLDAWCDVHIVHYLNIWYLFSLAVLPLKKPVVYVPYGTDWKLREKTGRKKPLIYRLIFKFIVKRKLSMVLFEFHFNSKYFAEMWGVRNSRKMFLTIIFPIRDAFYSYKINTIRKSPRYTLIFSPRTLLPFYNHHLLVEVLSRSEFKEQLVLLFIDTSNLKTVYAQHVVSKAKEYGIKTSVIPRFLSAEEMARMFLLSDFNVNIPTDDQFGMSIMEGALLCSVPVLNKNIWSYCDIMSYKNAIFVDPYSPDEAARTLTNALSDKKFRRKMCRVNRKVFENRRESIVIDNLRAVINRVLDGGSDVH